MSNKFPFRAFPKPIVFVAVAALFDVDLPEHWCFLLVAGFPFGFVLNCRSERVKGILFLCFSEYFTCMETMNS